MIHPEYKQFYRLCFKHKLKGLLEKLFPIFNILLNLSVFQVQAVLKRKEEEDQQMKQVVQTLQLALEKEKTKVKDLKEQVQSFSCISVSCALIVSNLPFK